MHGESLQSHREIEYIRATLECHIKRKGTSTSLPQASESTIFVARDSAHHQHHRQFGGWSGSFNLSPNPNLVKPSVKTRILSIETYITIEIALKSRSEGIFVQIPITVARNLPLDRPPLKSSHFLSPPLTVNTSQKAPPLLVTSSAHHGYDLISPLDETLSEIDEVVNLYTPPVSAGILKLDCLMNEIISDLSDSHLSSVTLSSDKLYSQNLSSEGESSAAEDSFIDTAYYSPSYN